MEFDIYKLADNYKLTEVERQLLEYILKNIDKVLNMGVREVANINYTSTATIIKLSKKLGYTGYTDMVYRLNFIIKNQKKNQDRTSDITSFIDEIEKENIDSFINMLVKNRDNIILITATGFSDPIAEFFLEKAFGFRI